MSPELCVSVVGGNGLEGQKLRMKTSASPLGTTPGASRVLCVWTPINSLHAGLVQGRIANASTKSPAPYPSWALALLATEIRKGPRVLRK